MECNTCSSNIKNTEYMCTDCINKRIENKKREAEKLFKQVNELKMKAQQAIQKQQIRIQQQRKKRQQMYRISKMKSQIQQLLNENMEIKLSNMKLQTENTTTSRIFNESNKQLCRLMQIWHQQNQTRDKEKKKLQSDLNQTLEKVYKLRRKMCRALFKYLPIQPHLKKQSATIFSEFLSLPIQASFDNVDPKVLAAALGYIILLIEQLAGCLDVVLPYQMKYWGSQSTISDPQEPNKKYPLYKEGVKNEDFLTALRMLNENVERLCNAQGLVVTEKNKNNFIANLLSLYNLPTIGCFGPFMFYTDELSNKPVPADNFYVDNRENVKAVPIQDRQKLSSTRGQAKRDQSSVGILTNVYTDNYFNSEISGSEIVASTEVEDGFLNVTVQTHEIS